VDNILAGEECVVSSDGDEEDENVDLGEEL